MPVMDDDLKLGLPRLPIGQVKDAFILFQRDVSYGSYFRRQIF